MRIVNMGKVVSQVATVNIIFRQGWSHKQVPEK
nr:MAG TPA: hypothetical protein [Caudoviricetes sp.]